MSSVLDAVPCGYAHRDYAAALSEFGVPLALERSGAWLLTSPIGSTSFTDAFGPYPLFSVENPEFLADELRACADALVSIYAISDPLRDEQLPFLRQAFDVVRSYKPHYVVDLSIGFDAYMRRHHRRYAKRAFDQLEVVEADRPIDHLDEWTGFYINLAERHRITGLRRFSHHSFRRQLDVPGCHYFRALRGSEAVGGFICYLDRGRAYAHLIATSPIGQSLHAQYALYWSAIEAFRQKASHFDLGGVPGAAGAGNNGLAFFKAGWSTSTRNAYFCSRILDTKTYHRLAGPNHGTITSHFPAYRASILGAS